MDPLMHEDEGAEALDEKSKLLEELMEFARGGMAKDMRDRYGKAPPAAEAAPAEEAPMDGEEPIPGVEQDSAADGGAPDPEMLKAILAKMKGG